MTKRKPTKTEMVGCFTDLLTDGCTMSPELEFTDFCNEHDYDYVLGELTREEADRDLRKNIASSGYPLLSWVYWVGVRLFGWFPYYFGVSYNVRNRIKEEGVCPK